MRSRLLVLFLVVSLVRGWACTCVSAPPPEVAYKLAAAVFIGRVVGLNLLVRGNMGDAEGVECIFEPLEIFKGEERASGPKDRARISVQTGTGGGDCGYPFSLGGIYLVYADHEPGLFTSICSRTKDYRKADEAELAILRKLRP